MQPVVVVPGNEVHVEVEDVLARGAAGGMEQVHGLCVECGPVVQGKLLRDGHDFGQQVLGQVIDVDVVRLGDDQRVSDADGVDVEECQNRFVLMDLARRGLAGGNPAENAVGQETPLLFGLVQEFGNPLEQGGGVEWLGHVGIGAESDAPLHVALLGTGGEHQNWRLTETVVALEQGAELETVNPGKNQVQDNQIRLRAPSLAQSLAAVGRGDDIVASGFEPLPDYGLDMGLIFDDQDAFCHVGLDKRLAISVRLSIHIKGEDFGIDRKPEEERAASVLLAGEADGASEFRFRVAQSKADEVRRPRLVAVATESLDSRNSLSYYDIG